ncbi:MAG TPA: BamA/TamA family outer membrane protein, partial [Vicinamibacterales bacterium]|nr:BamA/TamA family outer membrane protein [Vicinamibacterales bacterium]
PRLIVRLLLIAGLLLAQPVTDLLAASRYLPHLRFRVLVTPHFRIHYHQGGEVLAREVAAIAESVHRDLPARLGLPAPATVHVVLADQDDAANGSAFPLPYNTITLTAAWPSQSELIGYTRDWLRLVFVHEYAHILQTDQSRGWASAMRVIFGRSPVAFPNLALPLWQIEGFATWVESRETGEGRLRAGDAGTIVRQRIQRVGPEPLDRYNGGLVDWPGGNGPYLYGGYFHEYLASRFGERKVGELIDRQAGRLHYFGAGAYEKTFGAGLQGLWDAFQQDVGTAEGTALPPPAGPLARRLTEHGFFVASPRFTPDGSALLYTLQTPHRFPAVMRLDGGGSPPRTVTTQYASEGITVGDRVVVFDQLELETNVALRADLYAAPVAGGPAHRLTEDARLLQPALSPDGRSLVAAAVVGGLRQLAWFSVEAAGGQRLRLVPMAGPSEAGAHVGAPRWSPDGRFVAFERRVPDGPSEIALVEPATGRSRTLVSSPTHRNITPAWTPDGGAIVFASDAPAASGSGLSRSFQVYVLPLAGGPPRRLTSVPGGATWPVVSPDGRRLVYVGHTPEGYDLFEQPFDGEGAGAAAAGDAPGANPAEAGSHEANPAGAGSREVQDDEVQDRGYSPLNTLFPRAWTPVADNEDDTLRAGIATGGVDVLGRHAWGAALRWRVGGQHEAVDGQHRSRPDWDVGYIYDRWRTPLFLSASDETTFITVRTTGGARLPDAELRERSASLGLVLPFARIRRLQLWQAAFRYEQRTLNATGTPQTSARHAVEAGWRLDTTRRFGYSISPEEGGALGVATEQVRRGLGADGDAQAWTAQGRLFRRLGGAHSVLAVRGGGGYSSGDRRVRRLFFLGGAAPAGSVVNIGSDALELLRGLQDEAYAGSRIVAGSLEYRFPLTRVDRGWRTFPLFLRALHAAVFADGGHAWDSGFDWADFKTSVGAELSLDVVVGFGLPATVSAGVAWARDGASGRRLDPRPYIRIGRSF